MKRTALELFGRKLRDSNSGRYHDILCTLFLTHRNVCRMSGPPWLTAIGSKAPDPRTDIRTHLDELGIGLLRGQ
jgi:hypothetical protein